MEGTNCRHCGMHAEVCVYGVTRHQGTRELMKTDTKSAHTQRENKNKNNCNIRRNGELRQVRFSE